MDAITPTLWINGHDLDEVAAYYVEGLGGEVTGRSPWTVELALGGQPFTLLQGGETRFTPSEAVSFALTLDSQEEVDRIWDFFAAEGVPGPCGWIADRYGFSWQVVPRRLNELLSGDDPEAVQRVTACFMQVRGRAFDVAELEAAYAGS
jgi:predicted 3-demethylubiquinone-9 3-methyltransferase (glyoxalase superfamily)